MRLTKWENVHITNVYIERMYTQRKMYTMYTMYTLWDVHAVSPCIIDQQPH